MIPDLGKPLFRMDNLTRKLLPYGVILLLCQTTDFALSYGSGGGVVTSTDKLRFYCSPMVQFQLLHSKFHLCSVATRGLLLSTYIKFVNLFPEIKNHIQDVSCIQCILSFKFICCRYLNIIMGGILKSIWATLTYYSTINFFPICMSCFEFLIFSPGVKKPESVTKC